MFDDFKKMQPVDKALCAFFVGLTAVLWPVLLVAIVNLVITVIRGLG